VKSAEMRKRDNRSFSQCANKIWSRPVLDELNFWTCTYISS